MTSKELNRDVKRLYTRHAKYVIDCNKLAAGRIPALKDNLADIQLEYNRLYNADKECTYLTYKSLKIMIYLNFQLGVITKARFYENIKI